MESWNVQACTEHDGAHYYLLNRTRTLVKIHPNFTHFNLARILSTLEEVEFPLVFTEGLELINFTYIKDRTLYGFYENDTVTIDARQGRHFSTLMDTIVHEIAHHVDSEGGFSQFITEERKKKGSLIHRRARGNDEEYFARGFERFYSLDPQKRQQLKHDCPQLHSILLKLHRNSASK